MICSFSIIDESVVRSVQQDYITAADHQRLVRLAESASHKSVWNNLMSAFSRRPESRSRQEVATSFVRPEIRPTA